MKQHITTIQLNELSDEGKGKLREWWKPRKGDRYINKFSKSRKRIEFWVLVPHAEECCGGDHCENHNNYELEVSDDSLPLLSIGQMIEFLNDKCESFEILKNGEWNYDENEKDEVVEYKFGCTTKSHGGDREDSYGYDLCDVLFNMIKKMIY